MESKIYGLMIWTEDGLQEEEYYQTYEDALKAFLSYPSDENCWTSIEEIYEDEDGNEIRTDIV